MSDKPVIASVSGGKDSAAMCLWLIEQDIEYEAVFLDTGWEAPYTYDYLQDLEQSIGPIQHVRGPWDMRSLILSKGMFPGRICRFCTEQLKVFPFLEWVGDREIVNTVGIRAAESKARSKLGEWGRLDEHIKVWRPLIDWSKQDVIDIHHRHNLKPNPLYLLGVERVGCWPCIYARKSDLRLVARLDPERINDIRQLESDIQEMARQRYAKRGETFESLGYSPPAYFNQSGKGSRPFPIDDAVAWSRTSHGGRHLELDHMDDRRGCLRWGLCDAD